jgi:predicted Zn-dependent protease
MLGATSAQAAVKSTVDEWADRFLPETAPKIELPSYADDFDRARAEVTAGKYRAALSTISKIDKADPLTLDLLRARSLAGLGETQLAIELLGKYPKSVDAIVLASQIDLDSGNYASAQNRAEAAIAVNPDSLAARLLVAQSLDQQGKFEPAVAAYNWFLEGQQSFLQRYRTDPNEFENPDDITTIATAIHRWATLTQAYKTVPQLNDTVLNMFIRVFDVVDRQHIPSRIAAAEFALSRGDAKNAAKYIGPALARAGRDPRVLRIGIQLGMAANRDAQVRQSIDLFRDADPNSFDAEFWEVILKARAQQWVFATDRARALHTRHPNRLEAIGLRAALEFIIGNEAELPTLMAAADRIAPSRSDAQLIAGSVLSKAYQKAAAEQLLKDVLKRTPWETSARHELGDIYINEAREADALAVLDEAYKSDPYNIKTVNYLRLIAELEKYQKFHTEHFIIYFDADADPIVADEIGPFLEESYAEVTKVFQYQPPEKIIVQVYPANDEFSVRIAGVPGVENFGVSFGRVLATIAPRRGTKQGNFNWARVLKHEFVHTINLLQTNHRTPRWLTEGLAVWQEGVPFRFKEVPEELYKRTMAGKLFTIRGIPLAFVRPTVPADGEQAYTQGAYLAKYMVATFGSDSIVKLLNAYATTKSDDEAFLAATGKPLAEVESGWHAWMKEQLKDWGYGKEDAAKVSALVKEGEQALKERKFAEAEKSFAAAFAIQRYNVTVNQRLAAIYLQKETENPAKAIENLKFMHFLELQNNRYAKQIARMYVRLNDLPSALKWAREATYIDLYDLSSHELINEIATQLGDQATADRARVTAERIKLWDLKRSLPKDQTADPNAEKDAGTKPDAEPDAQ